MKPRPFIDGGFRVQAEAEGTESMPLNVIGYDVEHVLQWVRAAIESGNTRIVVVHEDRAIRDLRRSHGVSPDVEIDGPTGFRQVRRAAE